MMTLLNRRCAAQSRGTARRRSRGVGATHMREFCTWARLEYRPQARRRREAGRSAWLSCLVLLWLELVGRLALSKMRVVDAKRVGAADRRRAHGQ